MSINADQCLAEMLHPSVLCSGTDTVTSAHLSCSGVLKQRQIKKTGECLSSSVHSHYTFPGLRSMVAEASAPHKH